jgi:hypothetical protein
MTREELFSAFPRPWRLDRDNPTVIVAADGTEIAITDPCDLAPAGMEQSLAEMIVELSNEADA